MVTGVRQEWRRSADMLLPRHSFATAWMGGHLYVLGGCGRAINPVADCERFDPASMDRDKVRLSVVASFLHLA